NIDKIRNSHGKFIKDIEIYRKVV
ncbi:MAG: hypothetical protein Q620_VSAC00417G0001, partial [Veillonella sp. DORA_A_3_16_22]